MGKIDEAPKGGGRKACCLVSEVLEELGLNSRKARALRRQTLLGLITFCQWQLSRMDEETEGTKSRQPQKRAGRRVKVV